MAEFEQVIKWLKEGKFVRRPCWKEDSYWKIGKDEVICWIGCAAKIHLKQLLADDWEIYKEDERAFKPTEKQIEVTFEKEIFPELRKLLGLKNLTCKYCKKRITKTNIGGIIRDGVFCRNTLCLIDFIREQEK